MIKPYAYILGSKIAERQGANPQQAKRLGLITGFMGITPLSAALTNEISKREVNLKKVPPPEPPPEPEPIEVEIPGIRESTEELNSISTQIGRLVSVASSYHQTLVSVTNAIRSPAGPLGVSTLFERTSPAKKPPKNK